MNPQTTATIVVPLLAAVFGGVVVAITNNLFRRRLTQAEVRKLEAEAEKIRAEAESIRDQQKVQQHHLEQLDFVVSHLLSWNEMRFLREIAEGKDFLFEDQFREKDHLRRLRDLWFIEYTDKLKSIADLKNGDRLSEFLRVTDAGRTYLQIAARAGDTS